MVDDQKGGRYCKIPYHISGDDEGGDKISLLVSPFLDRRICLISRFFPQPSSKSGDILGREGIPFDASTPQVPAQYIPALLSAESEKKTPIKRKSS